MPDIVTIQSQDTAWGPCGFIDLFVINSKHLTRFTAQRITENYSSNPSLARKESNVFSKTQVIIKLRDQSTEEIEPEGYRKRMIAVLRGGKATFHLVGLAGAENRRPTYVE